MSLLFHCDRCSTPAPGASHVDWPVKWRRIEVPAAGLDAPAVDLVDLCPECVNALLAWIHTERP